MEKLLEWWYTPTPKEIMNKAVRNMERGVRRLERQRTECDVRERKCFAELKERARLGSPISQIKAIARDIARVRSTRTKIYSAQVRGAPPPVQA